MVFILTGFEKEEILELFEIRRWPLGLFTPQAIKVAKT
jgi:hypothetical protein